MNTISIFFKINIKGLFQNKSFSETLLFLKWKKITLKNHQVKVFWFIISFHFILYFYFYNYES